jgi:hypothetical protein
MSTEEWFKTTAREVKLVTPDDFLKIKETLTRIGIGTFKNDKRFLYQTCHILQKRGLYYIVHFKELLLLDGKLVDLSEFDLRRRNTIICFLEEWGLIAPIEPAIKESEKANPSSIKVIPFSEKVNWELMPKYNIGGK